ncbi:MAG: flagellar hook-length control protein FliK [Hydrogenovibrio crunogenus]|uniref:Flagellar hook-length control protein FliK n=1 Tax=Hydrogenovibrio crunogenus (strain DSM 25203 / XCL-2) TaxID=317025 RepID=Q31FP4_HYDCU|nr:flagellar hook-length control protein FliK [Hydrogenovibrio crunogenus]
MIEQTPVLNAANGKSKAGSPLFDVEERQSLPKGGSTFSEALEKAGKSVEKASSESKIPFSEIKVDVTTAQLNEKADDSSSDKLLAKLDSDTKVDLEAVLQQINHHPDSKVKQGLQEGVQEKVLKSDEAVDETLKTALKTKEMSGANQEKIDSRLNTTEVELTDELGKKAVNEKDVHVKDEKLTEKAITKDAEAVNDVQSMVMDVKPEDTEKTDSTEEINHDVASLLNQSNTAPKELNLKEANQSRTASLESTEEISVKVERSEQNEPVDVKEKALNTSDADIETKKMPLEESIKQHSMATSQDQVDVDKKTQSVDDVSVEKKETQSASLESEKKDISQHASQAGVIHAQEAPSKPQDKRAEIAGENPMRSFDRAAEQAQDKRAVVADDKSRISVHKDSNAPASSELKHSRMDSGNAVGNGSSSNGQSGSHQGQSSQQNPQGQQFSQQQQQMLSQLQKQQVSKEHQEIVKSFNDALSTEEQKTEKTEKILGNLGVSFDSRNQLPAGLQAITQGVRTPQWGHALGHRVTYMANNKIQEAKITLNPEKLGPIQIKLNIDKDQQVHVSMTAQHGTTREAIENAMPRLKEMLEAAGIGFGSLDVKDEREFSENHDEDHSKQPGAHGTGKAELGNDSQEEQVVVQKSNNNLVDYYA